MGTGPTGALDAHQRHAIVADVAHVLATSYLHPGLASLTRCGAVYSVPAPTTTGFHLRSSGVSDHKRLALTAVRAIVAASKDPEVKLSVSSLAVATGLTEPVVREFLVSDEYESMLVDECRRDVAGVLSIGVQRLRKMVDHPDDRIALKAIHEAAGVYRALSSDSKGHIGAQGEADCEALMKRLEDMNALRRVECSVVTSDQPSP